MEIEALCRKLKESKIINLKQSGVVLIGKKEPTNYFKTSGIIFIFLDQRLTIDKQTNVLESLIHVFKIHNI